MKRQIWLWQLMGFAVTALGGTLLHFLYEWFGEAVWIAPFSGVNESTWEHMKLLFWPMAIYALFESFFFTDCQRFWCVKLRGILLGLALIPFLYYNYNGIIGKSPDFVNIAIFFISAAASYIYETKLFGKEHFPCRSQKRAIAILAVIAALFVIFTFRTPEIQIFADPSGKFGI